MRFKVYLKKLYPIFCINLMLVFLAGCGITNKTISQNPTAPTQPDTTRLTIKTNLLPPFTRADVPKTPREFRAAWVATVDNIDWPSQPGLPVTKQKAELIAIMERAANLHLNAIIFQIRPSADALYNSRFEPWSYYLTGEQGEAPQPYYDPLTFAIEQAHKRGLELHVWFNPFRAYHPAAPPEFAPEFIKNTHPNWVVKYGDYYWLNPGLKQVREYARKVVMDVVTRYDIDGVHFDDYFYPYPRFDADQNSIPFPDETVYENYLTNHSFITLADWRRQNVNIFVKNLSQSVQEADSTLLFGISPFGIWRPGHPAQIVGLDAYSSLFADSRKWLRKGWVDYLAPQLYWAINNDGQRFPVLLRWWKQQNVKNRFVWPGLYTSQIANYPEYGFPSTEIINQIQIMREVGTKGHIHFSMKALMQNYGNITAELRNGLYKSVALVPAASWKATPRPAKPRTILKKDEEHYTIKLSSDGNSSPWLWVVKVKYGNRWEIKILPGTQEKIILPDQTQFGQFLGAAVSVVNKAGKESISQLLFAS